MEKFTSTVLCGDDLMLTKLCKRRLYLHNESWYKEEWNFTEKDMIKIQVGRVFQLFSLRQNARGTRKVEKSASRMKLSYLSKSHAMRLSSAWESLKRDTLPSSLRIATLRCSSIEDINSYRDVSLHVEQWIEYTSYFFLVKK